VRKLIALLCFVSCSVGAHATPVVYEFTGLVNSVDDCTINCQPIPGTYGLGDGVTGELRYNPDASYHPGSRDAFWKVFSYDIWINDIHIFDFPDGAYPALTGSSVPAGPGVSTSLTAIDEVPISTGGPNPSRSGYDELYIRLFGDVLNWVSIDRLPGRLNLDGITSGEIAGNRLPVPSGLPFFTAQITSIREVPEPGTLALLAGGLIVFGIRRLRRVGVARATH
jgi:hypothetical protein